MLTEALRAYLIELGVEEAASWSPEQLLGHMNETLLDYQGTHPESLHDLIHDLSKGLRRSLNTIANVLDGPQEVDLHMFEVEYYFLTTGMEGMPDRYTVGRYYARDEQHAIERAMENKMYADYSEESMRWLRSCLSAKELAHV